SCFFLRAEDGIRDRNVTGVQTCALPIYAAERRAQVAHVVGVEPDHAGLDGLGKVVCPLQVVGPDVGRQAVFDVVGQRQRLGFGEIGRASCRDRGGMAVVAVGVADRGGGG